mmetsp:Transcript_33792/g.57384  ORF Transcript_33792/g.57384 Transcript_33792/m.57384 type:complete len:288 (-) Transcript_33792:1392-2255(-)
MMKMSTVKVATIVFLIESHWFMYGECLCLQSQSDLCPLMQQARSKALSERRRDLIFGTGVISALLPWQSPLSYASRAYAKENSYERLTTSTKETAQYLQRFCNTNFLSSVVKSRYNYLYRGLSPDESAAIARNNELAAILVKDEPYDLLDPATYQSKDAASYFTHLENDMTAKGLSVKPSKGHLGTTCPKAAAEWGRAASIWPLGEQGVDFAWLKDGGLFWPNNDGNDKTIRSIITPSTITSDGTRGELSNALEGDAWEILFRADNGFLAVPTELDSDLQIYLMEIL